MTVSVRDLAWAAGVVEGEGTFVIGRWIDRRNEKRYANPRVVVKMTDEDVVRRLHDVLGGRVHGPYQRGPAHYKPVWALQIQGRKAAGVLMTLLPFLGERRYAKALEVLREWRACGPYISRRSLPPSSETHTPSGRRRAA